MRSKRLLANATSWSAVEYHKRFDDRSLMARKRYRAGMFGEFKLGTASLMEKWYYRHSNFQNWMTTENSDAFTYIGCHYVDLVHFITGLLPVSVSVYGVKDKFPNGAEGYLWTDARVIWNNGACLNVQNTLGYPDDGPGTNTQHIAMYCSSGDKGAMIRHSDQYRGIEYAYVRKPDTPGATSYSEPSADYFQFVDLRRSSSRFRSVTATDPSNSSFANASRARRPTTSRHSCESLTKTEYLQHLATAATTNLLWKPDVNRS